ncbi:hypothetical protein TNCV_2817021 [Trichonephila clavipes]|nr:hypothetical protein TNCV_2817021 [Trichonephila clavipes]
MSLTVRRYSSADSRPMRENYADTVKNPLQHTGEKGHPTASTNLTQLWTALANIWQVIPVERFQKLVESMPRHVVAVIKASGGPTRY